jgi:hypothetical protein
MTTSLRPRDLSTKTLVHGAPVVLPKLAATDARLVAWLRALPEWSRKNAVIPALAKKLLRIVGVGLARGECSEPLLPGERRIGPGSALGFTRSV